MLLSFNSVLDGVFFWFWCDAFGTGVKERAHGEKLDGRGPSYDDKNHVCTMNLSGICLLSRVVLDGLSYDGSACG